MDIATSHITDAKFAGYKVAGFIFFHMSNEAKTSAQKRVTEMLSFVITHVAIVKQWHGTYHYNVSTNIKQS